MGLATAIHRAGTLMAQMTEKAGRDLMHGQTKKASMEEDTRIHLKFAKANHRMNIQFSMKKFQEIE